MYYRDLIFCVPASDRHRWLSIFAMKVHETFHQHRCALAFPYWQDNKVENRSDSFDAFTRYADPGPVVRLFADTAEQLEAAAVALDLPHLEAKQVMTVMPVRPVPTATRSVAFCRSRALDRHVRITRQYPQDLAERDRREAAVRSRLHQMAYLKMISQTENQQFSLYVERLCSDTPAAQLSVTSYGLSRLSEPCFLPDF